MLTVHNQCKKGRKICLTFNFIVRFKLIIFELKQTIFIYLLKMLNCFRAANREEELQQQQSNLQDIPSYSPRHHFYENPANTSSAYGSQNQRYSRSNQRGDDMGYKNGRLDDGQRLGNGGPDMSGGMQTNGAGSGTPASGPLSMKERKKSLMTRLIPGRNAPSG